MVKRNFAADRPNAVWVGDITYIPTDQGWLYLTIVKDLCSRKVVGYAFSDRIVAQLATQALEMAVRREKPTEILVFHSDTHRQVVGTGIVDDELLCKVIQSVKVVARIETFLILTVAALDFAVVPRRIRADQLVPDAQLGGCLFKQRL